jgi:ligand-binding sensor domain-containing protein
MKINITLLILLFLIIPASIFASDIFNYASVNRATAAIGGDNSEVFVATESGLAKFNKSDLSLAYHSSSPNEFPDIYLTALAMDSDETLWIGTKEGYIYRRNSRGEMETISDLLTNSVEINDILIYDEYLLLGTSKGIVLFDKNREAVKFVVPRFDSIIEPKINSLQIENDTLFASYQLGDGDKGGVFAFPSFANQFETVKLRDYSSWKIVNESNFPVKSSLYHNGIFPMAGVSSSRNGEFVASGFSRGDTLGSDSTLYRLSFNDSSASFIVVDSVKMDSKIIFCSFSSDSSIFIGTEKDYMVEYSFSSKKAEKYRISGRVLSGVQRLLYTSKSELWTIPIIAPEQDYLWWSGVSRYKTQKFVNYSGPLVDGKNGYFGELTGMTGTEVLGLSEDSSGNIWVGDNGNCLKMFDGENWSVVYIDPSYKNSNPPRYKRNPGESVNPYNSWMKIAGMACNSMGVLWGTFATEESNLFAYNYSSNQYSSLLKREGEHWENTARFIAIDKDDNILVSFENLPTETGGLDSLLLISNDFDPFSGSDSNLVHSALKIGGVSRIYSLQATGVGSFLIGTPQGIYLYSKNSSSAIKLFYSSEYDGTVRSFAVERNEFVENRNRTTFWAAISGKGVVRFRVDQLFNEDGGLEDVKLVVEDGETHPENEYSDQLSLNELNGFSSSYPIDLAFDKDNNHLWIGYEDKLSRYTIEVGPAFGNITNKKAHFYPNPFSHKKHSEIKFTNLSRTAYIDIYTISGKLVAHLTDGNGASAKYQQQVLTSYVSQDSNASKILYQFSWKPPHSIVPGTYLVAIKNSSDDVEDETVLKKLVILP